MRAKRLFLIEIEYFKPSGKFYSEAKTFILAGDCADGTGPSICYMHDVTDEILRMRAKKRLPGLSGGWDGPIHVSCRDGFPCLVMPE